MQWSRSLIPTLRESPQEAEIDSHKLMLRAGLIRRLSGGLYNFLPLGLRALKKVEAIIVEEMDRAGALQVLLPALQPRELWDQSHRYDLMGDTMFRLSDRQARQLVLGPTHEEVITELAARELSSYRQLPKTLYQIQTKFRDEIRPRFGLMRAKEFIMKDAYSFDADWDSADSSYKHMYDAYQRIFDRCGLRTKIVEADTGAMGGKWSHEFMVLADTGEDALVECEACAYAANVERAERAKGKPLVFEGSEKLPEEVPTPEARTIDEVSTFLHCEPGRLIKTLIYLVDRKPVAILVPGDRDVNEHKLARVLESTDIVLANDDIVRTSTRAPVGFAGPVGLDLPIYADSSLEGSSGSITGGNKSDTHLLNVDLSRDTNVTAYHDLCIVRKDDACPLCRESLREMRGIEVGHVFKLGTKYSDIFSATYLDDNGEKHPVVMGCYGIGVTRTLQAVIEQSHDEHGIIWPLSVAPYQVAILVLSPTDPKCMDVALGLQSELEQNGYDVILDDRDERPGVKFKDSDLIGFPLRVVVSERSLSKNSIEVKPRTASESEIVEISCGTKRLLELAKSLSAKEQ